MFSKIHKVMLLLIFKSLVTNHLFCLKYLPCFFLCVFFWAAIQILSVKMIDIYCCVCFLWWNSCNCCGRTSVNDLNNIWIHLLHIMNYLCAQANLEYFLLSRGKSVMKIFPRKTIQIEAHVSTATWKLKYFTMYTVNNS